MGKKAAFRGSITALVTPFKAGQFDEGAFRRLVDWQIDERHPWPRSGRNDRRKRDPVA